MYTVEKRYYITRIITTIRNGQVRFVLDLHTPRIYLYA